ncbi:MAG: hypothetical protein HOC66_06625 [Flavobacteriales bacterium]|jgi:hypothetical protein|nr:hypothetical protein [Flavobacteriales bacterium]
MGYRNIRGYKIKCTVEVEWEKLPKHVKVAWERRNLPKITKYHHWLISSLDENCELPTTISIDKYFYIDEGFVLWSVSSNPNSDMEFDRFIVNEVILANIWWDHISYKVLEIKVKTLGEEMTIPSLWI